MSMNRHFLTISIAFILALPGCKHGDHFITDPGYRKKVEAQFNVTQQLASHRSETLFGVFNQELTRTEEEALKFLYAYMSLNDLADYDGPFFLKNVRSSLAARDTFAWGRTIPEDIFRHFVLPVRVNNENLDSSRWVFFAELKDRIRSMPMKDAVLEVNHWCHEKVTYRGTDGRTSSPLATVKTAFGRCGEESTFTVAALRSVGLPARQCYTPRWAHSDDNHAWVEVWVDGKWHFIGACEPEPELDLAWFTVPASRAMLVNTNVFGDYTGPEDVLLRDPRYTKINILSNYAPVRRIFVRVTDAAGKPADSASVEFQLYNYAEFYPIYQTLTNSDGMCSFQTGLGDLMIHAARKGLYAYRKISVPETDTLELRLDWKPGYQYSEDYNFHPPAAGGSGTVVSDSLKAINSRRLAFEDEIRNAYEKTFIDSVIAFRLAASLSMNGDSLFDFLRQSRGNWRDLVSLLHNTRPDLQPWIFPLFSEISEKDLRDADPAVLKDHLDHFLRFPPLTNDQEMIASCILNPRISHEGLRVWRSTLQDGFDTGFIALCRQEPQRILRWIDTSLVIDRKANYSRALLSPAGSFHLRQTDPASADLLFVALCRSFGIPARLETATGIPRYFSNGAWHEVQSRVTPEIRLKGSITVTNNPANPVKPEYYKHFTIEPYKEGFFRSLDYEYDPVFSEYPATIEAHEGYYMLVTGNRMQDGTVLANLKFFTVEPGKNLQLDLKLRKEQASGASLGKVDLTNLLGDLEMGKPVKVDPGKALILAWLEPDREPTKHLMVDLRAYRNHPELAKANLLLLFRNEQEKMQTIQANGQHLPPGTRYLVVNPGSVGDIRQANVNFKGQSLPIVTLITPDGKILFLSEGYRIGTGEELVKLLSSLASPD